MLRVVAQDGVLVLDETAVLPGRGAWVHDTDTCVTTALRRRAFGRALRVPGVLETATLEAHTPHKTHQRNG